MIRPRPALLLIAASLALAACEPGSNGPAQTAEVTFSEDIQPLIQRECLDCHMRGGIGPFSLETYEEAARFADAMAVSVRGRSMPPWLPSSDCQPFQHVRGLSEEEIGLFEAWAEAGAPEGEPSSGPAVAQELPQLPWVDLAVAPTETYVPDVAIEEDYRCFIIDPATTKDEYVIGYDIRPGVRWLVHHVNVLIAEKDEAEDQDRRDRGAGWNCIDSIGLTKIQLLGAWAPGTLPITFPEDTGVLLPAGNVLVTQVHYALANGNVEPDSTAVNLQLAHEPVKERAFIAPIFNSDFAIPPNSTGYASTFTMKVPFTATIWGVGGHMHQLGSRFHMSISRDADNTCLIDIPRWRYSWQQGYFYDIPEGIPVDTSYTLAVTCAWDNPTDQEVIWGEDTTDEMCMGYFYITGLDENIDLNIPGL